MSVGYDFDTALLEDMDAYLDPRTGAPPKSALNGGSSNHGAAVGGSATRSGAVSGNGHVERRETRRPVGRVSREGASLEIGGDDSANKRVTASSERHTPGSDGTNNFGGSAFDLTVSQHGGSGGMAGHHMASSNAEETKRSGAADLRLPAIASNSGSRSHVAAGARAHGVPTLSGAAIASNPAAADPSKSADRACSYDRSGNVSPAGTAHSYGTSVGAYGAYGGGRERRQSNAPLNGRVSPLKKAPAEASAKSHSTTPPNGTAAQAGGGSAGVAKKNGWVRDQARRLNEAVDHAAPTSPVNLTMTANHYGARAASGSAQRTVADKGVAMSYNQISTRPAPTSRNGGPESSSAGPHRERDSVNGAAAREHAFTSPAPLAVAKAGAGESHSQPAARNDWQAGGYDLGFLNSLSDFTADVPHVQNDTSLVAVGITPVVEPTPTSTPHSNFGNGRTTATATATAAAAGAGRNARPAQLPPPASSSSNGTAATSKSRALPASAGEDLSAFQQMPRALGGGAASGADRQPLRSRGSARHQAVSGSGSGSSSQTPSPPSTQQQQQQQQTAAEVAAAAVAAAHGPNRSQPAHAPLPVRTTAAESGAAAHRSASSSSILSPSAGRRMKMEATDTSALPSVLGSLDTASAGAALPRAASREPTAPGKCRLPYTGDDLKLMEAWEANVQILSGAPSPLYNQTHREENLKWQQWYRRPVKVQGEMAGESIELDEQLHNVFTLMRHRDRRMNLNYPPVLPVELEVQQVKRRPRTPRSFYGPVRPHVGKDWFRDAMEDARSVKSPDLATLDKLDGNKKTRGGPPPPRR